MENGANGQLGSLPATYTLIYHFLVSRGHAKTARSLKKAAKPVVDVKKAPKYDVTLELLVEKWVASNESSSDEESDDVPAAPATVDQVIDDSSSESDEGESKETPVKPEPVKKQQNGRSDKDPSHTKKAKKRKRAAESDDGQPNGHASPITEKTILSNGSAPSATEPQSAQEPPKKKVRVESELPSESPGPSDTGAERVEKGGRPAKMTFSRIKLDEVEFRDPRLKDNTFAARPASANDYGAQANRDLIVTRGAGFRKEKNKKKRGSYRGGEITMESHSIKFD